MRRFATSIDGDFDLSREVRVNLRPRWGKDLVGALAVLALLGSATAAHAGAWTREPYHVFAQIGLGFTFNTDSISNCGTTSGVTVSCGTTFDANGNRVPQKVRQNKESTGTVGSNYQQMLTDVYVEYGLWKRLTIFTDIPLVSMRETNPGGNITYSNGANIGDILVGLRGGILVDPIAIAIEVRMTAPSGKVNDVIPTGSGAFSGELRLAIGKAFQRLPIWIDFEMGFILRGTADLLVDRFNGDGTTAPLGYSPQLTIHGEVGGSLIRWKRLDRLIFMINADYTMSVERDSGTDASFTLAPRTPEFATVGAALMGFLYKGLGVSARFSQAVEGRFVPFATNIGAAVFYNY